MAKKGCLNCHFLCISGIINSKPVVLSVSAGLRSCGGLVERLNAMADDPYSSTTIKCFCDNWDAARIGREDTDEIIKAVFRKDRNKCPLFVAYDKYAKPDAIIRLEKQKTEVIDRKATRIMAAIAMAISFGSLLVSIFKP
jgi:hypothetical protein